MSKRFLSSFAAVLSPVSVALLVGTLFPFVAQAQRLHQREGTQIEVWNPHLGAFDWKITPTSQTDETVHFRVVLSIAPYEPTFSLARGPSATLSEAYFDPGHGYQITKDLRPLKLTIAGRSIQCDFSVTTKEEIGRSKYLLRIQLFRKRKKRPRRFCLVERLL